MRERKIQLNDAMPLILEKLKTGHDVTFSPRGTSMLPFIKEGRDTVTLSKPPKSLKKYDVALYQRKNGQYILHRVARAEGVYTFIGDNQFVFESGIKHDQIIGVCTSFVRKGKKISAKSRFWHLYAVFWHYSRFLRRIIAALRRRIIKLSKREN